jgi:geranylgeranyl transferase type-1 subunit beta
MLGASVYVDGTALRAFLSETQDRVVGGFGKAPGDPPDLLHAYFGLAGLALLGEPGIGPIVPMLNMGERAAATLPAQRPTAPSA